MMHIWCNRGTREGDSRTRAVTGVMDATKPVSVPALGPRQWSVGLAFSRLVGGWAVVWPFYLLRISGEICV